LSYITQIESLIVLQDIDNEIDQLKKTLKETPKEVESLKNRLEVQKNQKKEVEEKLNLLKEQNEKLTKELEEDINKLKKSKNKLMMVENSKEYHAVVREIDILEKNTRLKEEEKLTLEEELETQQRLYDAIEEEVTRLIDELTEKESSLSRTIERCEKRLEELKNKRVEFTAQIPEPILKRYEFIRSRLHSPVIVPVENSVCCGCHISIPPQVFNELQKGTQILSCPNCQRLIYWKEQFRVD